jgi:formylglycine-generating enzyme required for sulfatase activity
MNLKCVWWVVLCCFLTGVLPASLSAKVTGEKYTNSLGMTFIYIEPGTFVMGQTRKEKARLIKDVGEKSYTKYYTDEPRHQVTLTQGYYMQATEVTIGQYLEFLRETGNDSGVDWLDNDRPLDKGPADNRDYRLSHNRFGEREDQPMTNVSWDGAKAFAQWLSKKDGVVYRLPTEAEWEYACRAGSGTSFSGGDCLSTDQANYLGKYPMAGCVEGQYRQRPLPVASFRPNAWGLYDMQGNVWEWCQDWYGDYSWGMVTDPQGAPKGTCRVLRGGSWSSNAGGCRPANRNRISPCLRYNSFGFRLVLL